MNTHTSLKPFLFSIFPARKAAGKHTSDNKFWKITLESKGGQVPYGSDARYVLLAILNECQKNRSNFIHLPSPLYKKFVSNFWDFELQISQNNNSKKHMRIIEERCDDGRVVISPAFLELFQEDASVLVEELGIGASRPAGLAFDGIAFLAGLIRSFESNQLEGELKVPLEIINQKLMLGYTQKDLSRIADRFRTVILKKIGEFPDLFAGWEISANTKFIMIERNKEVL